MKKLMDDNMNGRKRQRRVEKNREERRGKREEAQKLKIKIG